MPNRDYRDVVPLRGTGTNALADLMGRRPGTTNALRDLSHAELYNLRDAAGSDNPLQATLGPMEHAAFAREWTEDQPFLAVPSLLAAIPAYTAAKALGLIKTRSPASLSEMVQAYRGVGQGLGL